MGIMDSHSPNRPDRYDTSGNVEDQYVDEAQFVLVNLLGITDLDTLQLAEEEALAQAYETMLGEIRVDTSMTSELLRHVHKRIFGHLYSWAGCWRTVWISKPGTTWPAPDFLPETMARFEQDVLAKYPATELQSEEVFCRAMAEVQGEFLVIHPFREGNARTIKLMTNLLAAQTDRPLLEYGTRPEEVERYTEGAKAAFKKDYSILEAIIAEALRQAQS